MPPRHPVRCPDHHDGEYPPSSHRHRPAGAGGPERRSIRCAHRSLTAIAVMIMTIIGAGMASASPIVGPGPVVPIQQPVLLDLNAHPTFTWAVPARFAKSWAAYNVSTGTYGRPDLLNPTRWPLILDACGSTSKYRITAFQFTISQVGTTWKRTEESSTCRLGHAAYLPAQGPYTVSLVLKTFGSVPGVSRPAAQSIRIRDYLIVSLGDSLASGEGNPDIPGSYRFQITSPISAGFVEKVPVHWTDKRCHRSALSGPALAAKAIEDASPHTSVTFISLACSGAGIRHLVSTTFKGIQPDGVTLAPQVAAARAAVAGRRIDAVTVSAGINDIRFADILERCAANRVIFGNASDCVTDGGRTEKRINDLPAAFGALRWAIRTKLGAPRVLITDYPAQVLQHGACGLLDYFGHGIGSDEGRTMTKVGREVNQKIRQAATYPNWHLVGGMEARFSAHSYACNRTSWFVTLETSYSHQGNMDGTAHPNGPGQQTYARALRAALSIG